MPVVLNPFIFNTGSPSGPNFVGSTVAAVVGATPVSVTFPTGTTAGDLVFIYGYDNSIGSYGTLSTAGWTSIDGLRYKVVDASDLTMTIDFSSTVNAYMVWTFRGVTGVTDMYNELWGPNSTTSKAWTGGVKPGSCVCVAALTITTATTSFSTPPAFSTTAPTLASAVQPAGLAGLIPGNLYLLSRIRYDFTPAEYTDNTTWTVTGYDPGSSSLYKRFYLLGLT